MGRQLNIRSDRAYELASELASKLGKSVTAVVEEALIAFDAESETEAQTQARWDRLLKKDREYFNDSTFEVEDLYDPETGLPA